MRRSMTASLQRYFSAVVFLIMAAAQAAAFTFSPMTATISPSGAQSVMTFIVTNDSPQQIAASIKVTTRSINESGVETNVPADSQFLVFPSRVTLQPNTTQNIKLQYRGPAVLTGEIAYRIIAEQLPVDFTKATSSGVNIMLRYVAALYVAPAKIKANVLLTSAIGVNKSGKNGLSVTIKNSGTRHAILFNTLIRIQQSSVSLPVEISGQLMSEIEGQNVLANSTRTFFVPWEPAVLGATYEGAFSAAIE